MCNKNLACIKPLTTCLTGRHTYNTKFVAEISSDLHKQLLLMRRYEALPTMHHNQWDILYRRSCGAIVISSQFCIIGMFHRYCPTLPCPVQNIPMEAMHCGKCSISSLVLLDYKTTKCYDLLSTSLSSSNFKLGT